jgi:OmpA-OmpF porin, OOP family
MKRALAWSALALFVPSLASAQSAGGGASGGVSVGAGGAKATAAAQPAAAADPVKAEAEEWTERDRKLNETTALTGGVGLLRTQHAQGGAPGQFRLSFVTEYFSAGFLCTDAFPCANPRGAGQVRSDSLDHIGGSLALTAGVTDFLELYMGTGAYANSTDQNRPALLQSLGDSVLGGKFYGAITRGFHAGGALELWLVNGTGAVGLEGGGTSGKLRGLMTADLRETEKQLPLRFSFNAGYSLDNTGTLIEKVEASRGTSITRIERFGLNINRVDHFDMSLGGEAFLSQERVRPFIEYNLAIPVNRQNYLCKPNNPSGDKCLALEPIAPSKLTFGGRFFPWKQGFALTAALDVGVTGTATFIEEVAPVAPWTLFLGAGWAADTRDRPPVEKIKTVEKIVEIKPPSRTRIKGFVHEGEKTEGIAQAIVSWDNHPETTSLATGTDGSFLTHELDEGPYTFGVKAEGFKAGTCTITLGKGQGPEATVDCPLVALPRVGTIVGIVKDAENQAAVNGASIKITDGGNKALDGNADMNGSFRFEQVSPGTATITVEADGYMSLVQPLDVQIRKDNTVDLLIRKRPKNGLVNVGKTEISIKQQVQFAVDSANILPESNALLTEIADALIHNPRIKRIEVQGHTDNSGNADRNKVLSEERASAVRTWLTSHGVTPDRLVAKGYGQAKPLVPNVTAANKARNRRVQLIITEQDAPEPKKK